MNNYQMILSKSHTASFGFKDNGNILVLGQVGTYKTRGHVLPNIMEQDNISMVISDTKGELQAKTEKLLREKGYIIKNVNFDDPKSSMNHFNPLAYIRTPEDILTVASILMSEVHHGRPSDPYWDNAATQLLQCIMAYLLEDCRPADRTLSSVRKLVCAFDAAAASNGRKSPLEIIFDDYAEKYKKGKKVFERSFALEQWNAFSTIKGSDRTASCIVSVLLAKFSQFLTSDISELTSRDDVEFEKIGQQKTALFVNVSDVDRSKDKLVSTFYSLLMSRLRSVADQQSDKGLPVHVHFFMDDFATNVVVPDFPNAISCLRSREISFTLVLQSENQLQSLYGEASSTVIANCAYYLFLGSRDLACCQDIAKRMNLPLDKVLYKARNEVFIISNFHRPIADTIYDVRTHPRYKSIENDSLEI
jgi:type IV secretion system protein VirD4